MKAWAEKVDETGSRLDWMVSREWVVKGQNLRVAVGVWRGNQTILLSNSHNPPTPLQSLQPKTLSGWQHHPLRTKTHHIFCAVPLDNMLHSYAASACIKHSYMWQQQICQSMPCFYSCHSSSLVILVSSLSEQKELKFPALLQVVSGGADDKDRFLLQQLAGNGNYWKGKCVPITEPPYVSYVWNTIICTL